MGHLVYPCQQTAADDYVYARTYDEKVKTALQQGKKVLLIPENVKGRKTKFASHFWNPIMFNWNPMIVGTLIDSNHPAFGEFPNYLLCRLAMVGHFKLCHRYGT